MMTENTTKNDSGEDFESLLEDSLAGTDSFSTGDKVTGKVVFIDRENVFIDITGKSDAIIHISEFRDTDDTCTIKEGESVDAYVVSITGGEILLTREIGRGDVNYDLLKLAHSNSIPVHGRISGEVKGGYTVAISAFNAFCPLSQVDIKPPAQPGELMNKSFLFKITQLEKNGRNIVLSRRALLEEVRKEKAAVLKNSLKVNDILKGRISSIQNFGIFVDIGGIDALVPRSEISRSRNVSPDSFKPGDEITASVISIDWESKKISMSIKQLMPDPWETIERYQPGEKVGGTVTNIIKQGAFIEIEPGLEGFIHISRMSRTKRIKSPEDVLSRNQKVNVVINEIKPNEKKLSLELLTGEKDPWEITGNEIIGNVKNCTIEASRPKGLHVRLENGMAGFIPKEKLKEAKKGDIQKIYGVGSVIQAAVIDFNAENQKLILSETEAEKVEINREFSDYVEKSKTEEGATLGAQFSDQFSTLREKLKKQADD
jgi:small subunit ribosomal protein S1